MKDKKSCANCGNGDCDFVNKQPNGLCDDWQRNPDLWLDIPPEIEGWYWLNSNRPLISKTVISKVHAGEFELLATFEDNQSIPVTDIEGQWQGPIAPKGE